ncbi:hypothetical protein JTB14_033832 [Gonioctena quinquepunctata]|nr:hypothetical protein JTB14_033832 [Gonioctena quinquepunctata]
MPNPDLENLLDKLTSVSGRKKTTISRDQQMILQNAFDIAPFVDKDRLMDLIEDTGLDRKVIKIWFQNRRQKAKKKVYLRRPLPQ